MSRGLVVAGSVLAGLAAGVLWTWLEAPSYRADARLLVRPATPRILPAVEALAESSLVAANVAQTLHLASPPRVSAKTGKGGVMTISVHEGGRERARQVDAEAIVILMQNVAQRFGVAGVRATVLDPAHVAEQTSPRPGRNVLIAGLAGLVAGVAVTTASIPGRRPRPLSSDGPAVERRLRARTEQVAKRERALAALAGKLAAREQNLDRRERELDAGAAGKDMGGDTVVERQPAPAREPALEPRPVRAGSWTIGELERLVQGRRSAFPDRVQEWETYLFFLREHASIDGSLSSSFDSLIADVFEPQA